MDSESKSQVKESSVSVPVENRFGSVLKPLVAFLSQDTVSSDILLWTQRCAAHPAHHLSVLGNLCMDGQKNRRRTDIELIRFFSLEIVELNTETAEDNIIQKNLKETYQIKKYYGQIT
jgi:hypothetical protein